jgi:hypothetical protein
VLAGDGALAIAQQTCQVALQLQHKGAEMKTATMPSLRVNPELRQAAEQILQDSEGDNDHAVTILALRHQHEESYP